MPNRTEIPTLPPIYGLTLGNYLRPEQVPPEMRKIFDPLLVTNDQIASEIAGDIFKALLVPPGNIMAGCMEDPVTRDTFIDGFLQAASKKLPQFSEDGNYRLETKAGFKSGKAFFRKNPRFKEIVSMEKVHDFFKWVEPKVNKRIKQYKEDTYVRRTPSRRR